MDSYKKILEILEDDKYKSVDSILYFHINFMHEWVVDNSDYFICDEDEDKFIKIFNETAFYLQNKHLNQINKAFTTPIKKIRDIDEIIIKCANNLKNVKKDLDSLPLHGQKTKHLLEVIEDYTNNTNLYIPSKNKKSKHKKSEDIKKLRDSLHKNGLPKESITKYIKYFQNISYNQKK